MNQEEVNIFRNQRVASPEGQAVIDHLNTRTCEEITCNYTGTELYACPNCGSGKRFCYQHQTIPDGSWHKCAPIRPSSDGTAGHSKGEFGISDNLQIWDESGRIIADCFSTSLDISRTQEDANCHIFKIAQSAPHDCGDPECPGVINKRKLELYDTKVRKYAT